MCLWWLFILYHVPSQLLRLVYPYATGYFTGSWTIAGLSCVNKVWTYNMTQQGVNPMHSSEGELYLTFTFVLNTTAGVSQLTSPADLIDLCWSNSINAFAYCTAKNNFRKATTIPCYGCMMYLQHVYNCQLTNNGNRQLCFINCSEILQDLEHDVLNYYYNIPCSIKMVQ